MSITELLNEIGPTNINFQLLDDCTRQINHTSKVGTTITFGTDAILGHELVTGLPSKRLGIVCWVPRDKAEEIFKRIKK